MAPEYQPQRLELGDALLELLFLGLHAHQHVLDHRVVLAAQAAQLEQLLDDAAAAALQQLLRAACHLLHRALHLVGDDLAPLRDQLVRQHVLELRQAAARQQVVVVSDLGHQALLRRHRIDARLVDAQHMGAGCDLARDLGRGLGGRLERVPKAIDLVQHGQATLAVACAHMAAPEVEVALGHAGVGRQHEHNDMRVRDQAQRQLGLGADRVEARRIEDDQALAQQRMREVDDRVAPAGNLDHAVGIERVGGVGIVLVVQAERLGHLARDAVGLDDMPERIQHAVGRRGVERHRMPVRVDVKEIGGGSLLQARLDRQQPDARCLGFVVAQLGRAHRGAPGGRRQDATAVVGKEDCVDQLALAPRELRDERHLEPVALEHALDALDAFVGLGVVEIVLLEPGAEFGQGVEYPGSPGAVLFELKGEGCHWHWDRLGEKPPRRRCRPGILMSDGRHPGGDMVSL